MAHMRVRANLTGKEYEKLLAFLRRWHDVPAPTPPVDPSPKAVTFPQPIAELRDEILPQAKPAGAAQPAQAPGNAAQPQPAPAQERPAGPSSRQRAAGAATSPRWTATLGPAGRKLTTRQTGDEKCAARPSGSVREPLISHRQATHGRCPVCCPIRPDDTEVAWLVQAGGVVVRESPGNAVVRRQAVAQAMKEAGCG